MNSVEGNGKVPLAQETLLLVVLYHLEHLEVLEVPKRVELYDIDRKSYNATDRYWVFITHRGAKFSNTRRARRTKSPLETNVTLHVQVCKFNKGKLKKKKIYIFIKKGINNYWRHKTSFTFGPGSPIPISPWSPGGPGNPRSPCEHIHSNNCKLLSWCTS